MRKYPNFGTYKFNWNNIYTYIYFLICPSTINIKYKNEIIFIVIS